MYPFFSENEVWTIFTSIISKDSPLPEIRDMLQNFRSDFSMVYDQILEEHAHCNRKYYRSKDGRPIINPLYIAHHTRLIYFFSRALFLKKVDLFLLDQLFFCLRTRCCIDLFYEVEIGKFFLPEHAFSSVLGRAQYGDYFVVCQNCTVGNNKNIYPVFGDGIILRPNSTVLGNCRIGNNVHVSTGTLIIDTDIPDNSIVFGRSPDLIIVPTDKTGTDEFFD